MILNKIITKKQPHRLEAQDISFHGGNGDSNFWVGNKSKKIYTKIFLKDRLFYLNKINTKCLLVS
jgi:hypothetical protein